MKKGFTLIELLVVIAVIGMLASIVLVSFRGTREKASLAKTEQFASSVHHALGAYAVGMWTFDEGIQGSALDSSGYGNNGTVIGAILTTDRNGQSNKAYSFNGINNYIDLGTGVPALSTFTVSFWWDGITGQPWAGPINYRLAGKAGFQVNNGMYGPTQYKPNLIIWSGSAESSAYKYDTISNYPFNGFKHMVWTWNGTTAKFYLNGVEQTLVDGPTGFTTTGAFIGKGYAEAGGRIDDVRIYAQAITTAQVQQLYAEGVERHKLASKF